MLVRSPCAGLRQFITAIVSSDVLVLVGWYPRDLHGVLRIEVEELVYGAALTSVLIMRLTAAKLPAKK